MSIRLTASRLRQIIREELRRGVNESDRRGKDAPHNVSIPVSVPHRPKQPDIEYANAVQTAMMHAQEKHGASYDVADQEPDIGEPEGGEVPYRVHLQRFSVKRPISDQA